MMTKICPICNKEVQDGDIVVALLLAKFKPSEQGYDLQAMAQTISSHLYCAERPTERQALDVVPGETK